MSALSFSLSVPSAWIRVSGEDAPGFLQSQFSNDLNKKYPKSAIYGLWLDRKGKVQADSFVLQAGSEEFYLASYFSKADTIMERLGANIIADDVDLHDETNSAEIVSWWGDGAGEFLDFLALEEPQPESFLTFRSGFIFSGRRSVKKNFDLITKRDEMKFIRQKINDYGRDRSIKWVGEDALHAERISSGIPAVPLDIGPGDIPQEGGLEKDAVCFEKGCFLGQEVMARLHTRGKARRRLYRVHSMTAEEVPALPCDLFCGSSLVGQLCSAVSLDTGFTGLALLKTSQMDESVQLSLVPDGRFLLQIHTIGGI